MYNKYPNISVAPNEKYNKDETVSRQEMTTNA